MKGEPMQQKYEYKFVRLGEGWLNARKSAREDYQQVIHQVNTSFSVSVEMRLVGEG
jgi:hypothetical protein